MKYACVTLSIIAIWVSIVLIVNILKYTGLTLPILALILTLILFINGFGVKK